MEFSLFTSSDIGRASNIIYPKRVVVTDAESMKAAVAFDHVGALYKENKRSNDTFLESDCLMLDFDNTHSEKEEDWVTPFDVAMEFPGVSFIAVFSRNHMKEKNGAVARPKFHAYFPVSKFVDVKAYSEFKKKFYQAYPFFDSNALDGARFFFGVENPQVEVYEGDSTIVEILEEDDFAKWEESLEQIGEGSRNTTMSHVAGKLIKRYGDTPSAYELFLKTATKCNPPLQDEELERIWNSAKRFGNKVSKQDGYIPPEQYNSGCVLRPEDFSDVGQATVLAQEYMDRLRYSPSTDYMVYNGSFWEESKPKSQGISQELTDRQLAEVEAELKKAMDVMVKNGAMALLAALGPKKAAESFNKEQAHSYERYTQAVEYKKYVIKRRDTKNITATLKEARPMLEISQQLLDADEFFLNTPDATYDLRKGGAEAMAHDPLHFITKQTGVAPGTEGKELWENALDTFFQKDKDLIEYVQKIVGLASVGKVYVEALIIAYGEGRNGKSTFWNVVSRVLGSYSGNISADMLTVGCRRNVKPELAEAKGKRLLIAAELEEGMRLNTSNVKQLCSTDEIYAEKKYKDPFSYTPTHTLVLYTNHLPKVGAIDKGTWRRLIVIPFNAKIEGNSDIKNYADYLYENAGGAILSWIMEGARKVIAEQFHIEAPEKVKEAIAAYRDNNDWMQHFLDECCEIDESYTAKSGEVYNEYRAFCIRVGEFIRSTADFYTALDGEEFTRKRTNKGVIVKGLRLKSEFSD